MTHLSQSSRCVAELQGKMKGASSGMCVWLFPFCRGRHQEQRSCRDPHVGKTRRDLNRTRRVLWKDGGTSVLLQRPHDTPDRQTQAEPSSPCGCSRQDLMWKASWSKTRGGEGWKAGLVPLRFCQGNVMFLLPKPSSKEVWNHPFSVGCWRCSGSTSKHRQGWKKLRERRKQDITAVPWRVKAILPSHQRGSG